jgi:hypothetical protein
MVDVLSAPQPRLCTDSIGLEAGPTEIPMRWFRGPRTREGKQRNSQNATSHGAYAGSVHPVRSGALAENSAEVEALIEAIATAKKPRDAIEREVACQIANALLGQRLAGRLEAQSRVCQRREIQKHCSHVTALSDPSALFPAMWVEFAIQQLASRRANSLLSCDQTILGEHGVGEPLGAPGAEPGGLR